MKLSLTPEQLAKVAAWLEDEASNCYNQLQRHAGEEWAAQLRRLAKIPDKQPPPTPADPCAWHKQGQYCFATRNHPCFHYELRCCGCGQDYLSCRMADYNRRVRFGMVRL